MYQRLIPSILVHQGRLVKGKFFKDYRDAGGPATTARAHNHQGADELIACDIEASKKNQEPDFETLAEIAEECFMPLTIFGGVNSEDRAARCMDIGADKVGLTTAALDHPELMTTLAHRYGAQAVLLGLDVVKQGGQYHLYDHRTDGIIEGKDPFEWANEAVERGCGEIRIMRADQEGMHTGFDLDLYQAMRAQVDVPLILEGGAESLLHLEEAYRAGVDAVAVGAMLVFSDANLVKIKQHMRSKKLNIRY